MGSVTDHPGVVAVVLLQTGLYARDVLAKPQSVASWLQLLVHMASVSCMRAQACLEGRFVVKRTHHVSWYSTHQRHLHAPRR